MSETQKIERCFWCGRPKDASIIEETEETLKNSVINNYQPCEKCKESFNGGIHVIGVTKEPIVKNMFPIVKDGENVLYPTGSMFVANEEFIKEMISGDSEDEKELLTNVLKERVLLIPNDQCEQIVNDAREAQEAQSNSEYINTEMEGVASNEEDVQGEGD